MPEAVNPLDYAFNPKTEEGIRRFRRLPQITRGNHPEPSGKSRNKNSPPKTLFGSDSMLLKSAFICEICG